jgi:hypothetical protein
MLPTIVLGESCFALARGFPGSMVGEAALRPVPRRDGTTALRITPDAFQDVFCADVPARQAARLAATQRPATQEAPVEPTGERPLWKELPGVVSQPTALADLIHQAAQLHAAA